jgi:ankyrin repeat protein
MDHSLRDAAHQGNIDALYTLIARDPEVLDRVDKIPFVETPLHTVASAGHIQFAMEIMMLKPSFARKPNKDGFTPMHLALQKLHLHALENYQDLQRKQTGLLVHRLLDHDKDIVRVQGREGVTPLHYVAQIGNLDLLSKFLKVCPTSIQDVTSRGETILHIALKYHHLDALKYLIRWLQLTRIENASFWQETLLNRKDDEGNTVLHIAVSNNQTQASSLPSWFLINIVNSFPVDEISNYGSLNHIQVVKWLLGAGVRINRKNSRGFTALDILQVDNNGMKDNSKMKNMLCRAGALSASSVRTVKSYEAFLKPHSSIYFMTLRKLYIWMLRQQMSMTNDLRNMLMVVVVLFITATYQAALSPPGGVWQDTTFPINVTSEVLSPTPHKAGKVIMNKIFFMGIFIINTLGFVLSAILILFLLLPLDITRFLCFSPMIYLYASYLISCSIISPYEPRNFITLGK